MAPSSDCISITIEITPAQKERIEQWAEQHDLSPETAAAQALARGLDAPPEEDSEEAQPGSFLDGLEHLVGSVEGPPDLTTNPKHMEGYGES
ncbi:MAG: hypothetical protein ACLFTE_11430 [Salinivenus sp.]